MKERLLELLDCGDYKLSKRAILEAKKDQYPYFGREPTESEIVQYIIASLSVIDVCLRSAPQGDPPGSGGIAWQMTDNNGIFIKLQICEIRFGEEYAYVQSCHVSKHV